MASPEVPGERPPSVGGTAGFLRGVNRTVTLRRMMFSRSPCEKCGKKLIFGNSSRICARCANTLRDLEFSNPLKHSPLFETGDFEDVVIECSGSPSSDTAFELVVGLLGIDSVEHFTVTTSHKTAFELLEEAVLKLSERINKKTFPRSQQWKGVLLAPEFFFHRSEPASGHQNHTQRSWVPINSNDLPHRCLTLEDRDTLIQKCKKLSSQYPDILIIPGSFLYRKPLNEQRRKSATEKVSQVEKKLGEKNIWTLFKQTEEDEGLPYFVGTSSTLKTRIGYVKVDGGFTRDTVQETLKKIQQYEYMLRNTMYGFYGGAIVLKYHKVGLNADIDSVDDNRTRTVFVSGSKSNVVSFQGVRLGMEICLDHDLGLLKKLHPSQKVDLHLIASGSVDNRVEHFHQASDGFVLHADSQSGPRGVFDGSNTLLSGEDVSLKTRVKQSTRTLTLYTIRLNPSN